MARESRRKRDERRFGKAERLADMVAAAYGRIPPDEPDPRSSRRKAFADTVAECHVIEATNVASYYDSIAYDSGFNLLDGLPCLAPPFQMTFVEAFQPRLGQTLNGWLFVACHEAHLKDEVRKHSAFKDADFSKSTMAKWWLLATLVIRCGGQVFGPIADVLMFVDADGTLLDGASVRLLAEKPPNEHNESLVMNLTLHSLAACCLALCFINCKNVALETIEPDPNKSRKRRKAGLRPFVRYHTINIEPMKRILRTEGNVETEGLKRALHICRGHFATYSPEKPLFGRVAGTFWVPAHVRGSLSRGAVVSDYSVSPPTADAAPSQP